jgi:nucleotide-binding universal stress UspA family protein
VSAFESGRRALATAARIARDRNAVLIVVAAVPDRGDDVRCCGTLSGSSWKELTETEARAELEEASSLLYDCTDAEFEVASGSRVAVLVKSAEVTGADAIIVAGRSARALRRRAPCTVLPGAVRGVRQRPGPGRTVRPGRGSCVGRRRLRGDA